MRRSALPELSGSERDKKTGWDGIVPKKRQQPRHTFLQADPGINVHFDGNLQHGLLLLSATLPSRIPLPRQLYGTTSRRKSPPPLALDLGPRLTFPGGDQAAAILGADNCPRWPWYQH